jgi:hypothetical protein
VSDVRIRPYRLDDAAVVVEAVQESLAELSPWMPWAHAGYSLADSRRWLETNSGCCPTHYPDAPRFPAPERAW